MIRFIQSDHDPSALYERPNGSGPQTPVRHQSCCRADQKRARRKRSIAFLVVEARPFEQRNFLSARRFREAKRHA